MEMSLSPVDELAAIRAKIALLRARESALEARFLENNEPGVYPGFNVDVVVERTMHEVFDIAKLPNAVLNDPRYYAQKVTTRVHIEEHDDTALFLTHAHARPQGPKASHPSDLPLLDEAVIDEADTGEVANIFATH